MRRRDGRYMTEPTLEPFVEAAILVFALAFIGYVGVHVIWAMIR
jgi:hypothetical protein